MFIQCYYPMEILILIAAFTLSVLGILGCILPGLPGPPLSYVALLLIHFTKTASISPFTLWFLAGITLVVLVLDYLIPVWGTRRFGGSKNGAKGAIIGLIAGFFAGPMGIITGPFIGAMLGEMIGGRRDRGVLKAAFGSFVGFLAGIGLKLITSLVLFFYLLAYTIPIIF